MNYDTWKTGADELTCALDSWKERYGFGKYECDDCMKYEENRVSVAEDFLILCSMLWSREFLNLNDVDYVMHRMAKNLNVLKEFEKDYESTPRIQREFNLVNGKQIYEEK